MDAKTLFAVRATFNDPSGTATHEYLYGTEPTVFRSKAAAESLADELQKDADHGDWGQAAPPKYHVEMISESDMWEAETIDDDDRSDINRRIDERLTEDNIEKLLVRLERASGVQLVNKDGLEDIIEDVRIWVCETFADPIRSEAGQ